MSNIRSNAIVAAELIRAYWRKHPDAHKYQKVEITFKGDYELESNIKNGYPPLVGA